MAKKFIFLSGFIIGTIPLFLEWRDKPILINVIGILTSLLCIAGWIVDERDSKNQKKEQLKQVRINEELQQKIASFEGTLRTDFNTKKRYSKALSLQSKGDSNGAIKVLKTILQLGDLSKINRIAVFVEIGKNYQALGLYEEAIAFYNKALIDADTINHNEQLSINAKINQNLGLLEYTRHNSSKAINHYTLAEKIFRELNAEIGLADIFNGKGILYQMIGRVDEAIDLLTQAVAKYGVAKNKQRAALALSNLGIVYRDMGQYHTALSYYLESLAIPADEKPRYITADANLQIGIIYRKLEDLLQSENFLKEALKIYEEDSDKVRVAYCLGNLGILKLMQGKLDESQQLHEKALGVFEQLKDKLGIANEKANIGNILGRKKEWDEGVKLLNQALTLHKKINYQYGVATALKLIGILYLNKGEKQLGRDYITEAKNTYNSINNITEAMSMTKILEGNK